MRLRSVQRSVQRGPVHGLFGRETFPGGAILHYDADIDAFSEQTCGAHAFNHAVLSPQYQRNADGSYSDVGAKPAVDVYDGEKWLRSCGAVTNLLPSGVPSQNSGGINIINVNNVIELAKTYAIHSRSVLYDIRNTTDRLTFTIALRAGSGTTGNTISIGFYSGAFQAVTASKISGPGSFSGTTLILITELSATEYSIFSVTLTANMPSSGSILLYPGGASSAELGASVLIKDSNLTATAYPVPYVPPGVTQPASNATTTNGSWFTLPDGSPLWHALDGGPETDGVELAQNPVFTQGTSALNTFDNTTKQARLHSLTGEWSTISFPGIVSGGRYKVVVSNFTKNDGTLNGIKISNSNPMDYPITQNGDFIIVAGSTQLTFARSNVTSKTDVSFNISIQRIQPQPFTLATRVRMGVGSGDIPLATILRVLDPSGSGGMQYVYENVAGEPTAGFNGKNHTIVSLSRGSIIRLIGQVNTAGTQFRSGYYLEGTSTAISWSDWAAYTGTLNPSTLYRLMLGYNNQYPMWFNKVTAWKKQVTDAEILEAMA